MKFTLALTASLLAGGAVAAPGRDQQKQKPSFALEGYAKENPFGKTTGGKGGPTTTVTAANALATAVQVGHFPTKQSIHLASISDSTRVINLSPLSLRVTLIFLRASRSAPTRASLAIARVQPSLARESLSPARTM